VLLELGPVELAVVDAPPMLDPVPLLVAEGPAEVDEPSDVDDAPAEPASLLALPQATAPNRSKVTGARRSSIRLSYSQSRAGHPLCCAGLGGGSLT
jgi:hypothetical protein